MPRSPERSSASIEIDAPPEGVWALVAHFHGDNRAIKTTIANIKAAAKSSAS